MGITTITTNKYDRHNGRSANWTRGKIFEMENGILSAIAIQSLHSFKSTDNHILEEGTIKVMRIMYRAYLSSVITSASKNQRKPLVTCGSAPITLNWEVGSVPKGM